MLNGEVLATYEITLEGTEAMGQKEWKNNIERYSLDTIILPLKDLNTGNPIPLVSRLSNDRDWD